MWKEAASPGGDLLAGASLGYGGSHRLPPAPPPPQAHLGPQAELGAMCWDQAVADLALARMGYLCPCPLLPD